MTGSGRAAIKPRRQRLREARPHDFAGLAGPAEEEEDEEEGDDKHMVTGGSFPSAFAQRHRAAAKPAAPATKKDLLMMKLGMKMSRRGSAMVPARPKAQATRVAVASQQLPSGSPAQSAETTPRNGDAIPHKVESG